jgi:hypothetical protein
MYVDTGYTYVLSHAHVFMSLVIGMLVVNAIHLCFLWVFCTCFCCMVY